MTYKAPTAKDLPECDVVDITSEFEKFQGPAASFIGQVAAMQAATEAVYPLFKLLTETCLHLHAKHYHSVSNNTQHDVSDKSDGGSACVTSSTQGNIDTLGIEQSTFMDVNQTGMIFGRDYGFANELDLPRFYKSMFNPDVNEYSEQMMSRLQSYDQFIVNAMADLYMSPSQTCVINYKGLSALQNIMTEYLKDEDVDDNGLIYGTDFIIDDIDAPSEIAELNDANGLVNDDGVNNTDDDTTAIEILTWKEYLETLNPSEPKETIMECQISPFTKKELIDELIEEFESCKDQNDDGLIYGKDFLIIGDSKPVELNPYVPLYLPDVVVTWMAYVKSREYNQANNLLKYETLLIDENIQNQDLDGNGIVYGKDFIIIDPCIADSNLSFIEGEPGYQTFSLTEYNDTIKPYIEDYVLDENIQAAKFNAEYADKADVDGNGLMYGIDFILCDYEGNKTECLWTIERYRNMSLSWTPEKIIALKLIDMISNYTQSEFDQYWICSTLDDDIDDGPGNISDDRIYEDAPGTSISYDCESALKPIIPLDFNAYDLSGHIILYNGLYWFDLGPNTQSSWSGTYLIPDGTEIDLSSADCANTFEYFEDSIVYHIVSKAPTSDNPYVFNIVTDGRKRVFPSERFFSIIHECLTFNEAVIQQIEASTETINLMVVDDQRIDATAPFDKDDITGYLVRWIYDDILETGRWVLWSYYERVVNRVMILDRKESRDSVNVPLFKGSDEFTHFLPFILNMVWNDI